VGHRSWDTLYAGSRQLSTRPATSIQKQTYAMYRTLPVLKRGAVFADCLKFFFLISFSEEMVGLSDFLFIRIGHFRRKTLKYKRGYYNFWFSPLFLVSACSWSFFHVDLAVPWRTRRSWRSRHCTRTTRWGKNLWPPVSVSWWFSTETGHRFLPQSLWS